MARSSNARRSPLDLEPIAETASLREQVYAQLRDAILSGRLEAGTQLSPAAIGRDLGVSTMPVREALRVLAEEGLVETAARRWTRVAAPDPHIVHEIYPLVAMLEEHAVTSGRAPTKNDITQLRRANDRLARSASKQDILGCLEADNAFHHFLAELSASDTLKRILADLKARTRLIEGAYFRSYDGTTSVAKHEAIIEALERGDSAEAGRLDRQNWLGALEHTPTVDDAELAGAGAAGRARRA